MRGFAAPQCGKAMPYRTALFLFSRLCLRYSGGGVASEVNWCLSERQSLSALRAAEPRQKAESRRSKTEDGRRKTGDGRRRTGQEAGGRRQTAGEGRPETEDGRPRQSPVSGLPSPVGSVPRLRSVFPVSPQKGSESDVSSTISPPRAMRCSRSAHSSSNLRLNSSRCWFSVSHSSTVR